MPAYKNVEIKVSVQVDGCYGSIKVYDSTEELYRTKNYENENDAWQDVWQKWQEIKAVK